MTTLAEIWTEKQNLPAWAKQSFKGFCLDSRKVQAGQIFIALKGNHADLASSRHYVEQALAQGAVGVLCEMEALAQPQVYYQADLRFLLGMLQQRFWQARHPQHLARAVAVTGTNGKTTVSRLVAELLTLLQQPTAVMGTTGNGILPNLQASTHTTLDALQFQEKYYQYSQQGAKFLSLEASSHGIEQGRLTGTPIEVAAFTNLSRDHLDYHQTLDNYAQAKAQLFAFPSLKYAVLNADDDYCDVMQQQALHNANQPQICRFSSHRDDADYVAKDLTFSLQGATFQLICPTGQFTVHSPLLGRFNVDNVLAAMIMVEKLGFAMADIVPLVQKLHGAPGRMQTLADQNRLFIVDYAHTPDALQQVLNSLKRHVEKHLWVVFGCGGDRDRGKRPLMAQAALDGADHAILTTDNPRTENPQQIFADMCQGIDFSGHDVHLIEDRREAIKYVVKHAQAGDIVVIAGKGHENYQEIDGVRHWFDDAIEVRSAIEHQHCQPQHAYPAQ